ERAGGGPLLGADVVRRATDPPRPAQGVRAPTGRDADPAAALRAAVARVPRAARTAAAATLRRRDALARQLPGCGEREPADGSLAAPPAGVRPRGRDAARACARPRSRRRPACDREADTAAA